MKMFKRHQLSYGERLDSERTFARGLYMNLAISSLFVSVFTFSLSHGQSTHAALNDGEVRSKLQGQPGPSGGITQISGTSLEGKPIKIALGHSKGYTLLLGLSPSCPFCRVNFHNWRELSSLTNVKPVWMDVTGTANSQYLTSYGIGEHSEFVLLSTSNVEALKIEATPTTIVLDSHGEEIWRRSGVIKPYEMQQLKTLLSEQPIINVKRHMNHTGAQ